MIQNLKQQRMLHGMSQDQLANLIGASSRVVIINWEKGRFKPSKLFSDRISKVFEYLQNGIAIENIPVFKPAAGTRAVFEYSKPLRLSILATDPGTYNTVQRPLKQAEVARAIGANQNMVAKWEKGTGKPGYEYQQKLSKLFRVLRGGTPISAVIMVGLDNFK